MQTPTTIGFIAQGWAPDPGGVETHTEALSRALQAAGLQVVALVVERDPSREPHTIRETLMAGVRVRRMNLPEPRHQSLETLSSDPASDAAVREWLVTTRPSLVHVHHLGGFGFGAMAEVERTGTPLVVTLHDYWPLCPRGQMLSYWGDVCMTSAVEKCATCVDQTWFHMQVDPDAVARRSGQALASLRGADLLISPSRAALEVYVRSGLRRDRFAVVINGIEAQTLKAETVLARHDLTHGRRLGVLGSVHPSKGVLELAHAVCLADVPRMTLEVHGPLDAYHGDATYLNALKRIADQDARVRLHGRYEQRDLARVLATLDAVAVPSRWEETFGLTMREARCVGLPVIAARRGGLAEFTSDPGITFVESDHLDDWVAALREFEFERVGPTGITGLVDMASEILGHYRKVIENRGTLRPNPPTRRPMAKSDLRTLPTEGRAT